jgi:hypothetical protein
MQHREIRRRLPGLARAASCANVSIGIERP